MNEIKQTPEYQSLLKRFRHLLESKTIAEFDEVIPRTYGKYRKNIYAFDEYIKGLKAAIKELIIENERLKASQPAKCEEVASHSEKEIANGCITLMHELVGRFEEYLEFVGFEPKCEDERFCVRFYYSEIIRTLFLEGTSHSGGTSTSKKCRELGFDYSKTVDFEIERRVEE